jgi:hypothetical protein
MHIPLGELACDGAHQQLVPVNLLGSEYVAVRYRDRLSGVRESVPWTMVGAVDGTALTYDPAPPVGAPATINRGQTIEFNAVNAFSVRSGDDQHPFYLAGHMTGGLMRGNIGGNGDPETVNTVPPTRWLNSYLFITDPTYGTTNLVFVRRKTLNGQFDDVTLDCFGPLTSWQPIGSDGLYQFSHLDLVAEGKPNGRCDNGVHSARSNSPFGLTVWGWDPVVSYAYPAGMSVRPVNSVIVVP